MKEKLRNYFKKNLTAYSYLFFAQVIVSASKIYLNYTLHNPPKVINDIFSALLLLETVVSLFIIPLVFVFGFLVTFKYPKDMPGKISLFCFNLLLVIVIIYSAVNK